MVPGVWLARYFKVIVPAWFKHHWRVQAVAVVIALVAVLLAFVGMLLFTLISGVSSRFLFLTAHTPHTNNVTDKRYYFDPSPHSILGLTIVALILLQVLLGYLSNALWHAGKPPHFFPDKLHWYCGRLALVLGIVNIYLGTREYVMAFDVRAAAGGWAVVGVMGAVVVGATIMMEWGMFDMELMVLTLILSCSLIFSLTGMGQKHEHEQLEREEREERYARFESMPLINGDVDVPGAAAPLLSSDGGADPTSTAAATSSLARQGCVRGSWSRNVAIGFFTLTMLKLCVLVGGFLVALLYE